MDLFLIPACINTQGATHDTEIGRVYVDDPDDWDLADKRFEWKDYESIRQYFSLNQFTGMITMSHGVPSQSYLLEFKVSVLTDVTLKINFVTCMSKFYSFNDCR